MGILTVNAGSSSIRLATFAAEERGQLLETRRASLNAGEDPRSQLRMFLRDRPADDIAVVAHRIVHGGPSHAQPCLIDPAVTAEIERLSPLAPLHNPVALRWIAACDDVLGRSVPQVAAFDTAFHAGMPQVASTYALPRTLCDAHGLRRYGFHGLAHEAMWRRWRALRPTLKDGGRAISLQLGGGCSITAVRHGQAIDTSMGFTPLEGLVMSTRAGDVDSGLLTFLQRAEALTPDALERLVTRDSGLLGLAGDGDMRALLARNDAEARLAVDIYCYRASKYIGAYLAVLGGVDAILFGGGVGEHAAPIRAKILRDLEWLGIVLDEAANRNAVGVEARISRGDCPVEVWVIAVDEAQVLARAAFALDPAKGTSSVRKDQVS